MVRRMSEHVFISHASKDAAVAQAVLQALEARGLKVWIAPRDIVAGREWEPSIVEALRSARAVVLVFSGAADASAHVRREVAAAADASVPVVPFRIDRTVMGPALSYYLQGVHWLDAADRWEARLDDLADTVQALVGGEAGGSVRSGAPPSYRRKRARPGALFAVFVGAGVAIATPLFVLNRHRSVDAPPASSSRSAAQPAARPAPLDPAEAAPEALVRRLYARGGGAREALTGVLTADLLDANARRLAENGGEGARRDWRYPPGDDRPRFEDLTFETAPDGDRAARVIVRWGGFMRRREATYALCRRPDGRWRVADVSVDGRSLREVNSLPPPDPLGCQ